MADITQRRKTSDWTGEPDPLAAKILALALVIGVLGFMIIGAATLTG